MKTLKHLKKINEFYYAPNEMVMLDISSKLDSSLMNRFKKLPKEEQDSDELRVILYSLSEDMREMDYDKIKRWSKSYRDLVKFLPGFVTESFSGSRDEMVELLSSSSDFNKEELNDMSDDELSKLWDSLEMDDWQRELNEEDEEDDLNIGKEIFNAMNVIKFTEDTLRDYLLKTNNIEADVVRLLSIDDTGNLIAEYDEGMNANQIDINVKDLF